MVSVTFGLSLQVQRKDSMFNLALCHESLYAPL